MGGAGVLIIGDQVDLQAFSLCQDGFDELWWICGMMD